MADPIVRQASKARPDKTRINAIAELLGIMFGDATRNEPETNYGGDSLYNDVLLPGDMDPREAEAFITNRQTGGGALRNRLQNPFNKVSDAFRFTKQLPRTLDAIERAQGEFSDVRGAVTPGAGITLRVSPKEFDIKYPDAGAVQMGGRTIVGKGPLLAQIQRHEGIHANQDFKHGTSFDELYGKEHARVKALGKDQYDAAHGNKFEVEADSGLSVEDFFRNYPRKNPAAAGAPVTKGLTQLISKLLGR